jgi:hypothetical protein
MKKTLLKTTLLFSLLASSSLFAEDTNTMPQQNEAKKMEHMQKMKEKMMQNHDARAKNIQIGKDCINSATTPEALKNCREEEKGRMEQMKAQHQGMKEKREQMREQKNKQ